ncbi:5'-AMP-activated protein kinase subunit beta-2 [Geodia barretti]|uniref:5'-AMP-activated protein kinase subunit beta-2 n=1 Tax=Geodia barretti TaxID=519541 RepID=A0AA35RRG6_GEOBA|nr:5'-AMP-activated protein kinase subunit beta-2 [Geodia barretti]
MPHTSTSKPLNKGPFQSTKVSLTTGVFTTPGGVCTGGSSPQGSYDLIMPPRSATSGLPPHLPPLLQQTVLNQEPPSLEDPNLLVEPNHVILNHLYALSIKDNVLVLAATHRFQQKYITTLVYKPI